MKLGRTFYAKDRAIWRAWLAKNHGKAREIWLIFHRKSAAKPNVGYNDAVEEALCFGWIDSQVKNVDARRYAQRFSPRRPTSGWSDANKVRMRRLLQQGKLTAAGRATMAPPRRFTVPPAIMRALRKDQETWKHYKKFPASYKQVRIGWIAAHIKDRPAEYRKRLAYFLKMTKLNKLFGTVR